MRYESKPIHFTLQVDEDTPLEFIGDELRIRQILNNLLSNAFKYTESGEVTLSVSATSESDGDEVTLILRVSDTGYGMNEQQVEKLFDEYERFNIDTNRTVTATGLWMNITKRLLDLMDGRISVESEPDKGTVFTVYLPQKKFGTVVCGPDIVKKLQDFTFRGTSISKKAHFLHEYMPYGKVLIVDDVESNLFVAKGLLIPYGIRVDTAKSGFEAVERVKKGFEYDIIFMDHMMPQMDGVEATRIIRSMAYSSSIVALTANAMAGQAEMFLSKGFDAFIAKPIDSRELDHLLKALVRDKQSTEVVEEARRTQLEKISLESSVRDEIDADEGTVTELEKHFVMDAEDIIAVLKDCLESEEPLEGDMMEDFITAVHGIKSALANIGRMELSDVARKLEQAGKERKHRYISTETPALIDALQALVDKFTAADEADANVPDEMSQDDELFLLVKLNEIKMACEAFNVKAVREGIAELKQKTWPRETSDVLEQISTHLLRGEFKKITDVIVSTSR